MKILDYLFYLTLCVVASIGLMNFHFDEDIYFSLPTFESSKIYEVYEKEQWQLDSANLVAIDMTQIDPTKYLITYLSKDKGESTKLHGVLFYPSKYSTMSRKGVWQNITTNTKTHSQDIVLFNLEMLKAQTRQYAHSLHSVLAQNFHSSLYLFLNATLSQNPLITRTYIFQSSLEDIAKSIESDDIQKNTDTLFSLYKNPALSLLGRTNVFFSHKPSTFFGVDNTIQGIILPFYTHINDDMTFFGIFNKELQLEGIVKPYSDVLYTDPILIPLPSRYDINHVVNDMTTHQCLALYTNTARQSDNKPNLAYQLCKISNGVLQFEDIQESKELRVGAMSAAVFGRYVILIYTNKENTAINLAVWNGSDFITLKELDKSIKAQFINPRILIYGTYAYIVYAKDMQDKINVITLNETYINNLITSHNAMNQNIAN